MTGGAVGIMPSLLSRDSEAQGFSDHFAGGGGQQAANVSKK